MMDMEDFGYYLKNVGAYVAWMGLFGLAILGAGYLWVEVHPLLGIGIGGTLIGVLVSLVGAIIEDAAVN